MTETSYGTITTGWQAGTIERMATGTGPEVQTDVNGVHHIFSLDKNEIGCTDTAEHIIELMDDEPFKERFWRIAPPLLEEIWENLQDMLDGGAIGPSKSPWCNAIVLVRKKDGTLRFCIDFRKLNSRTKKDSFPLPCMQETMESMVGARFFSSMDLKSGFWQVRMSEKSRQYDRLHRGKPRHV